LGRGHQGEWRALQGPF